MLTFNFILKDVIDSMSGGQFNNCCKIKKRYVQYEKINGFIYGLRQSKMFEDSPAKCQRRIRKLRKIKGFEKITHINI